MKLSFLGAAREVTGSCFYLETEGKHILIDCGMEQGTETYENPEMPINPSDIDCVFLTHAHIDHSGHIPLLFSKGFRGKVYATQATARLCDIMLRDSAHIQMSEAEWHNRKAKRAGKEEYTPLYTMEDAIGALRLFIPCDYDLEIPIMDGIKIRFTDVGHLLGSASIEVWVTEQDLCKKIVFSGDIGNKNQPLIKDPQYISCADYVVMESTYGDRNHDASPNYVEDLAAIIQRTFDRGGNLVIPSFAVGRTQELLYFLRQIKEQQLVKNHGNFPVFVDSPLAVQATQIFMKSEQECFDEEAMALVRRRINPLTFPGLQFSITSDESKGINFDDKCKVIISASGMCEAGRIRHHLKHNLWRKESTILFVGYQARGTLGRLLLDGVDSVRLFGEDIEIQADIMSMRGLSGHADKDGLIEWVSAFKKKPQRIFVVHGETDVCESFSRVLAADLDCKVSAPYPGEEYDLAYNVCVKEGTRELVRKNGKVAKRTSHAFERLLAAGQRLMTVIRHNEGGANKDLGKLADQINALCDKWDR